MKKIEELYKQYIRDIYRYLVSMNHNGSLSEDLLSETYINAMNSIGNFKKESDIKALYKEGILTITFPKEELSKKSNKGINVE